MSIFENITLSLQSLRANKMRALLTMLGIIIGISAVIGIVTLGDSLTGYITDNLSSFGANTVEVFVQSKAEDNMYYYYDLSDDDMIQDYMLDALAENFADEIDVVKMDYVGSGVTTEGRAYANLELQGTTNGYFESQNYTLLRGRYFTERDLAGNKRVCVVSDKLVNNMFGDKDPIGQQIFVEVNSGMMEHTAIYTIVGVYEYDIATMGYYSGAEKDITTPVYIPVTAANKINSTQGYYSFLALVNTDYNPTVVADQIASYLNGYYSRNENYGVQAVSLESMLDTINSIFDTVQLAISAIAAISLLVGGIGVMNIMLVSITERTHEIGIRKALGATNGEIRVQFIVEAMIICLIGGFIGIILGTLLGMGGAALLGAPARPGLSTVAIATGFSMGIGVFFGYYPANKAAKLDPIEALRYE